MKERLDPWVRGVLWLIIGILLWVGACSALAYRESLYDSRRVSYRNESASFTADDLLALRKVMNENGGGTVAGFAQSLSQRISAKETTGSTTADVLFVDGNVPLAWNLQVVCGDLPMESDVEGCALDQETALLLFGSMDIVGRSVWLSEQEWIVRGVFTLPDGLSTLAVDPGRGLAIYPVQAMPDGVNMTALEFTVMGDSAEAKDRITNWMREASLSTAGTFDDHRDQRIMLSELMTFPSYVLFLLIFSELFSAVNGLFKGTLTTHRTLKEDHVSPNSRFLTLWGAFLLSLALIVVFLLTIASLVLPPIRSIPPSYLPTKWSDFSFWSTLVTDALQAKARQALTVSLRPDMVWGRLTDWCAWLPFAAVIVFWHAKRLLSQKQSSLFKAAWLGCAVCAFLPVSGLIVQWIGWIPDIPIYAFALPVLLYGTITIVRCGFSDQWLKGVHRVLRLWTPQETAPRRRRKLRSSNATERFVASRSHLETSPSEHEG